MLSTMATGQQVSGRGLGSGAGIGKPEDMRSKVLAGRDVNPDKCTKDDRSKASMELLKKVLGGGEGHKEELGSKPSLVPGLDGVQAFDAACGISHSVVLSDNGEVSGQALMSHLTAARCD